MRAYRPSGRVSGRRVPGIALLLTGRKRGPGFQLLDPHVHSHRLRLAPAPVHPTHRRDVSVVAPDADPDVMKLGPPAVRGIERGPAGSREQGVDPGVRGLLALRGAGRGRSEVARDVPRRNAGEAEEADREVRKVLAHAAA